VGWIPGAAGQFGNRLADGEVGALDEGRVDSAAQPSLFEARSVALFITSQQAAFDFDSAPPALMFDHLGIGKLAEQNPDRLFALPGFPLAEVGS
jgi:hypothetical protein